VNDLVAELGGLPAREDEEACIVFLRKQVSTYPDTYSWLQPILESTLDEETREFLISEPPRVGNHTPNTLYEQLDSASRLLEVCLVQRQSIHSLETTAILSALDIEHALKTNGFNAEIERQRIRYFASQGKGNEPAAMDPAETALNQRTAEIEASLRNKLVLHGKDGSALNYGQRVKLHRYMYKENVRACYERLDAIRKGMSIFYYAKLPKLPKPATTKNHVLAMVKWMRIAMDIVDRAKPYERIITKTILVSNSAPDAGADFKSELGMDKTIRFRFGFYPGSLVDIGVATETMMVLQDISAAWLLEDNWSEVKALASEASAQPTDQTKQGNINVHRLADDLVNVARPRLLSDILLIPPRQNIFLDDLPPPEKSWQPVELWMWDVSTWSTGTPLLDSRQNLGSSLANCSPVGVWELSVPIEVRVGSSTLPRSQLSALAPKVPGGASKKTVLSDLMVTFSVLVNARMAPDERLVAAFEEAGQ